MYGCPDKVKNQKALNTEYATLCTEMTHAVPVPGLRAYSDMCGMHVFQFLSVSNNSGVISRRAHTHSQGPLLSAVMGPWNKRDATHRDQEYLLGIKRIRRLYCNVGIGFHLQVSPNGQISGAHNESPYTLLEISPVSRGVVTLYGLRSGLFVSMTTRGKLYGSDHYQDECNFKEKLLVNNYNTYESAAHPGMYIGISKTGKIKRGNRATPATSMTHFLPRV
ncbi:fibroblast growth factor 4A-like [Eucyclogobius newberryi]|uniref:fibroblast growth factor 4A-like n=1 Tax=Eucyclogobius newberryi TaxID=166745 RepID=UPI003B5A3C80